jgi:uncharacterized protein with HEPN domain
MPKNPRITVSDCLAEIAVLQDIEAQMTLDAFRNDAIASRAAAYAIQTLAQAVEYIPDDWMADFPAEPWARICEIGNGIRCQLARADDELLWEIITTDARALKAAMESMLARHADQGAAEAPTFGHQQPKSVSFAEIHLAFEFVDASGMGEHLAYLCKQTGKIYWHSESGDDLEEELPHDLDDEEKYIQIPDKRELDLGKPLVLDFAARHLPNDYDEVQRIFRKKGAYGRFKDLLAQRNALERWYEFEAKAQEKALREWCDLNDIALSD